MRSTDPAYATRLANLEGRWWKQFVPNPYAWHIRHVCQGRVLDVGCGIGRCLHFLDGRGVGVDPNAAAVDIARRRGLEAYTPQELEDLESESTFDTLLSSHVLEHLEAPDAVELLRTWLPRIRVGGCAVLICPQERGQRSDATHVRFMGEQQLRELADEVGLTEVVVRSFPLPRRFGRLWTHNESVLVGRVT
jgi:2-polyprenyl-3-methyl-5-hydroxy-6-metoxy-1,4-benzoquinol methylase